MGPLRPPDEWHRGRSSDKAESVNGVQLHPAAPLWLVSTGERKFLLGDGSDSDGDGTNQSERGATSVPTSRRRARRGE